MISWSVQPRLAMPSPCRGSTAHSHHQKEWRRHVLRFIFPDWSCLRQSRLVKDALLLIGCVLLKEHVLESDLLLGRRLRVLLEHCSGGQGRGHVARLSRLVHGALAHGSPLGLGGSSHLLEELVILGLLVGGVRVQDLVHSLSRLGHSALRSVVCSSLRSLGSLGSRVLLGVVSLQLLGNLCLLRHTSLVLGFVASSR